MGRLLRSLRTALLAVLPAAMLAAAFAAPAGAAGSTGELVIIVSARSSVTALRSEQVAAIFLGQSARFPDGMEAVPLDQRLGTPLRDEFYLRVANKTPPLLKAWWSKMVFTGRGQPPAEATDSAAVRRRVADHPDMIGYIDRGALDPSVRAVMVVQ